MIDKHRMYLDSSGISLPLSKIIIKKRLSHNINARHVALRSNFTFAFEFSLHYNHKKKKTEPSIRNRNHQPTHPTLAVMYQCVCVRRSLPSHRDRDSGGGEEKKNHSL